MSAEENITHPGIVDSVTGTTVYVKILAMSACASCHAKSMCSVADVEEKVVEVKRRQGTNYLEGQQVTVTMKRSLGGKAVLLGYALPFLILMAVLLTVLFISGDEGLAGISAILVLVPYYWLLYRLRDKLKRTFSFEID